METEKLVIKHLSKRGELLDCINCPVGQITVLRAEQESDLIPFKQALHGDVSGQKFSIYFNNTEYDPRAHMHIGFGSWLNMESTASETLVQAGVPEGQIQALASSFGILECLNKKIASLSADFERRVELLVAIYSPVKILVMEAPFEHIPQMWRDRFAELLLNDTILKRRVTLLTRLCYRPESWVGNTAINRVQVGSSVKKTIGFGQDSADFNKLVRELRGSMASEQAPGPAVLTEVKKFGERAQPKSTRLDNFKNFLAPALQSRRTLFYGGAAVTACAAAFALYISTVPQHTVPANIATPLSEPVPNFQVASKTEEQKLPNQEPLQVAKISPMVPEKTNVVTEVEPVKVAAVPHAEESVEAKVELPPPPKATSLDVYPMEIRKAIMEAFREKDIDLGLSRIAYDPSKKPKAEEDDNPFKAISKLAPSKSSDYSGGSYSYPPPPEPSSQPDADFAARQEEIRRRFLEALQRANSN